MAGTVVGSKLAQWKADQRIARASAKAREIAKENAHTGAGMASGWVFGAMKNNGTEDRVPRPFGLHPLVSAAIIGRIAAGQVDADMSPAVRGLADAATFIASYRLGAGDSLVETEAEKAAREARVRARDAQRAAQGGAPAITNGIHGDDAVVGAGMPGQRALISALERKLAAMARRAVAQAQAEAADR